MARAKSKFEKIQHKLIMYAKDYHLFDIASDFKEAVDLRDIADIVREISAIAYHTKENKYNKFMEKVTKIFPDWHNHLSEDGEGFYEWR